jgi:transcriptional regulator with XRE-family HTH domain
MAESEGPQDAARRRRRYSVKYDLVRAEVEMIRSRLLEFVRMSLPKPSMGFGEMANHEAGEQSVVLDDLEPLLEAVDELLPKLAEDGRLYQEARALGHAGQVEVTRAILLSATQAAVAELTRRQLLRDHIDTEVRYRILGGHLRRIRLNAGFTLDELSDRIGLSRAAISTVEHGKRTTPLINLAAWADACDHALSISLVSKSEFPVRAQLDAYASSLGWQRLHALGEIARLIADTPMTVESTEQLPHAVRLLLDRGALAFLITFADRVLGDEVEAWAIQVISELGTLAQDRVDSLRDFVPPAEVVDDVLLSE